MALLHSEFDGLRGVSGEDPQIDSFALHA